MRTVRRKISDFKLAEQIVRSACDSLGVPFIDLNIEFAEDYDIELVNSELHLPVQDSLAKTIISVCISYIDNLDILYSVPVEVSEKFVKEFSVTATSLIRDFIYGGSPVPYPSGELEVGLVQFPFVWIIMRDFVGPENGFAPNDTPVLMQPSSTFDAARWDEDQDLILLNTTVMSEQYRDAFLLCSAIESQGHNVKEVVAKLFQPEVQDIIEQFARLVYTGLNRDESGEFLRCLAAVAGVSHSSFTSGLGKQAQLSMERGDSAGPGSGGGSVSWFMPTLTEGLLAPMRGDNMTIKEGLEQMRQELWDKVTVEKERRGLSDLTLEDMLRVLSDGMKPQPGVILQGLLSNDRIW
jgi:hypothetical protein